MLTEGAHNRGTITCMSVASTIGAPWELGDPISEDRIPVIVEALQRISALQGLEPNEYAWLARHSSERLIENGVTLFRDGDPATSMIFLLKGEVHFRRAQGGPSALFVGRSGQITGYLPFSRMKTYGGGRLHGRRCVDAFA